MNLDNLDWSKLDLPSPPKVGNGENLNVWLAEAIFLLFKKLDRLERNGCLKYQEVEQKLNQTEDRLDRVLKYAWKACLSLGGLALAGVQIYKVLV